MAFSTRWIAVAVFVMAISGVTLAARSVIINYFAEWFDAELPTAPCQTFEAPQPVSHVDLVLLFYQCTDGRTIVRTFTPPSPTPQPVPVEVPVTCPNPAYAACGCLPAGSYSSRWLGTVGCR